MRISSTFSKLICTLDGGASCVDLDGETIQGFRPIMILPRQFYRERTKLIPIDNFKQLKKVLALRPRSENETVLTKIGEKTESGFWVKDFIFNSDILVKDENNVLMCIPETELLASVQVSNTVVEYKSKQCSFFVYSSDKCHWSSIKKGNINSVEIFSTSIGAPIQQVDEVKSLEVAEVGISSLSLATFLANSTWCYNGLSAIQKKEWLFKPAIVAGSAFALYMLLSSAYLLFMDHRISDKLAQNMENMQASIQLSNSINEHIQKINAMSELTAGFHLSSLIWPVLEPLFHDGVKINSLDFSSGSYVLRCEHSSASQVLAMLQNNVGVAQASFDSPVVSRRNMEVFTIRVKLAEEELRNSMQSEGISSE